MREQEDLDKSFFARRCGGNCIVDEFTNSMLEVEVLMDKARKSVFRYTHFDCTFVHGYWKIFMSPK